MKKKRTRSGRPGFILVKELSRDPKLKFHTVLNTLNKHQLLMEEPDFLPAQYVLENLNYSLNESAGIEILGFPASLGVGEILRRYEEQDEDADLPFALFVRIDKDDDGYPTAHDVIAIRTFDDLQKVLLNDRLFPKGALPELLLEQLGVHDSAEDFGRMGGIATNELKKTRACDCVETAL